MSSPKKEFSEDLARAFEMPRAEAPAPNPRKKELDEILDAARHEALGRDFADRLF